MADNDLAIARDMIAKGVPVFRAIPAEHPGGGWNPRGGTGHVPGKKDGFGYYLPDGWENTPVGDYSAVDKWREGDALCAVMGFTVDAIDVDPRNGGREGFEEIRDVLPVHYGIQKTPSGGEHMLIKSLGLNKKTGFKAGVDYQGQRSFVFLAPTKRISKATGKIARYRWRERPDLTGALNGDASGVALGEILQEGTSLAPADPGYEGPVYKDLDALEQGLADQHVRQVTEAWRDTLDGIEFWGEKQTDVQGRGWEALATACAWAIASVAAQPWTNLDEDGAHALYGTLVPQVVQDAVGDKITRAYEQALATPPEAAPWGAAPVQPSTASTIVIDPTYVSALRHAHLLAQKYGDSIKHVEGLGWFIWTGQIYLHDSRGALVAELIGRILTEEIKHWEPLMGAKNKAVANEAKMHVTYARAGMSFGGMRGILKMADHLAPLNLPISAMDGVASELNTPSGVLDLETFVLHPHDPARYHSRITNGSFDPLNGCPTWERVLQDLLPDPDVRELFQKLCGLALRGDVTESLLPFLTGPGGTGKSTVLDLIRIVLGTYAGTFNPEMLLNKPYGLSAADESELVQLRGKRFVAASEISAQAKVDQARLKRLSSTDSVVGKLMGKNRVEFAPSHLMMVACNHLPAADALDDAIWRRVLVIAFEVKTTGLASGSDPYLKRKLLAEQDGILTWMVHGLRMYHQTGLVRPAAVIASTDEYKRENDALGEILEDAFEITGDPHDWVKKTDVSILWQEAARLGRTRAGREVKQKLESLGIAESTLDGYLVFRGMKRRMG